MASNYRDQTKKRSVTVRVRVGESIEKKGIKVILWKKNFKRSYETIQIETEQMLLQV